MDESELEEMNERQEKRYSLPSKKVVCLSTLFLSTLYLGLYPKINSERKR